MYHCTSGSGLFYVLSGQHVYAASQSIAVSRAKKGLELAGCVFASLFGVVCGCLMVGRLDLEQMSWIYSVFCVGMKMNCAFENPSCSLIDGLCLCVISQVDAGVQLCCCTSWVGAWAKYKGLFNVLAHVYDWCSPFWWFLLNEDSRHFLFLDVLCISMAKPWYRMPVQSGNLFTFLFLLSALPLARTGRSAASAAKWSDRPAPQ